MKLQITTNKIKITNHIMESKKESAIGTIAPEQSSIQRTIGVEIECLVPYANYGAAVPAIQLAGGDIHGDGSINTGGDERGVEVVTKAIKGNEAEATIRAITSVLNAHGTSINTSTGLHVHCDAPEISPTKVCRPYRSPHTLATGEAIVYIPRVIFTGDCESDIHEVISFLEHASLVAVIGAHGEGKAAQQYGITNLKQSRDTGAYIIPSSQSGQYYVYIVNLSAIRGLAQRTFNTMRFMSAVDPVLRGLVPTSRRHNRYCQPLEKKVRSGGQCPNRFSAVIEGMGDRYCGINFRALEKYGTLENRYHQGTTNAEKIIHWARLWEACVRFALTNTNVTSETDTLLEVANTEHRLEMLCALLDLPQSTTEHLQARFKSFKASDARLTIRYCEKQRALAKRRLAVA